MKNNVIPGQPMTIIQWIQGTMRAFFEAMSEGVALISKNGEIIWANSAEARIAGLDSPSQRIGQHFCSPACSYYAADGLPLDNEGMTAFLAMKRKRPVGNSEIKITRGDGSTIWCSVQAFPIVNESGKVDGAIQLITDITEQVHLRNEREKYLADITRVQEEERKRLSRELHDEIAQSLSLLVLELDVFCQEGKNAQQDMLKRLEKARETARNTLNEVRRYSHELRPGMLDNLGLIAAMESLVEDLSNGYPVRVDFIVTGDTVRMADEVELAIFRIAQESLTNIRKHSGASHVRVSISFRGKKVKLSIVDNGKGFNIKESDSFAKSGHLGLVGMRERANLIKGTLIVKTEPGKGTRISVDVPLA
jgi:two-component system sensor histidine kinase DegS